MRLDDRAADRQSHAHTVRLGGEEGVEQTIQVLGIDADAEVLHRHEHLVSGMLMRADQELARPICLRHGLNTVHHEIDDDLLQLHPVPEYWGQRPGQV